MRQPNVEYEGTVFVRGKALTDWCTGNVTVVSGEFKKTELCTKVCRNFVVNS